MTSPSAHIGGQMPEAIRGAAALMVAVGHCWQVFLYPLTGSWWPFQILGALAAWSVATFFLLSGILIARSIKGRSARGGFRFGGYLAARLMRIYPPLLAAMVITVGSVVIIQALHLYGAKSYRLPGDVAAARENASIHWPNILSTLFLTYNLVPSRAYPPWLPAGGFLFFNGPLWSLSYEFWIYVLAGLLCAGFVSRRWWAFVPAAVLIWVMWTTPRSQMTFLTVGIVWGAGFAVGWMWGRLVQWRLRWFIMAAVLFGIMAALIAQDQLIGLLVVPYGGERQDLFYIATSGVLLCAIIILIQRGDHSLFTRVFARIGGFSYTLYLIHFPLMMLSLSVFRPLVLPYGEVGQVSLAVITLVIVLWIAAHVGAIAENRSLLRSVGRSATILVSRRSASVLK